LENQIFFLGNKKNPYIWMKNAELFLLSSKFEGFGLVLVESMAVDTFVISSNCKTGPKEILQDGKCGDLFEIGNFEELANKIEFALLNEEYKKDKILKAKKRIKEFDRMVVMKQLIDILESSK
jgi:hypothetical protein